MGARTPALWVGPLILGAALLRSDSPCTPLARERSAREVDVAIRARGAAKVLAELHAEAGCWQAVYKGIASGDKTWLQVGRDLASAADAGWAYQIDLAFGEALAREPSLVLQMAPDLRISCGSVDDPFTASLENALNEVKRREESVERVNNPRLVKEKATCLRALAELREALPRSYSK